MESIGITGVEAILLVGGVMGFIELVKKLFEKDWKAAIIIFGSGLVGGLLSLFPEMSFSFLTGIVGGLTASGVIKTMKDVAKKSDIITINSGTLAIEEDEEVADKTMTKTKTKK